MGGQSYTVDQLEFLRDSPLVQKPEGLPSILQWMDVTTEANTPATANTAAAGRRPRSGNLRDGDAVTSGDNRAERIPVMHPMGQFGRRTSMQPEDTVLGPPKLAFTSAHRTTKAATEPHERRTGITSTDGDHLGDRFPRERGGERWVRDRDTDRPRDKAAPLSGRRPGREEGEGWTNVKGRKSLGQDDFDRGFGRNGDREREKAQKEGDTGDTDATTRRAAAGRTNVERWGRREEASAKDVEGTKFGVTGSGGWRDRERDREQRGDREPRDRGDRDWNRGASKAEQDPEWMDSRAEKKETKAHTQEDFQRWKELMKAKDTPAEEKEEPNAEPPPPAEASIPASSRHTVPPSITEPNLGALFGNWGRDKAADTSVPETIAKPRKEQKSRFISMFTKPEEPTIPDQLPSATPASPPSMPMPGHVPGLGADADKEGFQRILQMLGGANISAAVPTQANAPAPINGSRQGGIALDFQRQSQPEEPQENRPPARQQLPRTLDQQLPRTLEQQHMLENILAPRPILQGRPSQARLNAMSPDNAFHEQYGLPRPDSNRPGDEFSIQQPPPRNSSAQDAHLHAILNGRGREESRDPQTKQRERDFLLTLMQQPSRGTPPQMMHQNIPRPAPENQNMAFFDPSVQRHQGQPKGRPGLPLGFIDDQRIYQENEMMRRETERREQQIREANLRDMNMQHQQEAMRNKNARLQMNFAHEDPAIMNLQRRNTGGEVPRQLTNMGIPSQAVPEMQYLTGGRPVGMPPAPQERSNIAPPPGFGGPPMRQPPGLGGHGGQQQQQMGPGPSFSAGNTPLGHPPGFAPPGMRGGMYPGQVQGNMPPQGLPQGYFPPPGYGPPVGLRGGEANDPRMMFEQQFAGLNRGQPGRPGPPNMY